MQKPKKSTVKNLLNVPKIKKGRFFLILTLMFFSFSFLGWLGETVSCTFYYGQLVDRGYVSLPLCPLYGSAPILIYALLRTPLTGFWGKLVKKSAHNRALKIFTLISVFILYALISALIATAVEFATGFFLDKGFGVRMWDYTDYRYNLCGYVCPPFALLWGALIAPAMAFVFPLTVNMFNRMPDRLLYILAVILIGVTLCDFLFNLRYSIKNGGHLDLSAYFEKYLIR